MPDETLYALLARIAEFLERIADASDDIVLEIRNNTNAMLDPDDFDDDDLPEIDALPIVIKPKQKPLLN